MIFENSLNFFRLHDHGGKGSTSSRFYEITNTSTPVTLCDYYKVDQTMYLYIHINELALHRSLRHSAC